MWKKLNVFNIESNHLLLIGSALSLLHQCQIIHKVVVLGNQYDCNTADEYCSQKLVQTALSEYPARCRILI